jgi:carbamoyl-phosphate synthase small subunit
LAVTGKPVFSFQGHPEASPGPNDLAALFDKFINNMQASATTNA